MTAGPTWGLIREAIGKLRCSGIPEWEIDAPTADAALEFCDLLENIGAAVPKIFHHGGDALVFNWSGRMLTVSGEDDGIATVLDMHKRHAGRLVLTSLKAST